MGSDSKNKRLAKNTIYLYIRTLFAVCINLYTSRLVLEYLGVEDFGVYNIVGGIVALMMFVNTSMRGATSRFITFSLGKNELQEVKNTNNPDVGYRGKNKQRVKGYVTNITGTFSGLTTNIKSPNCKISSSKSE